MSAPWVFFDAAFTLIWPHPSVGSVYARHGAAFGVRADAAALDAGFRAAWKAARARAGKLPYGRTLDEARAFWYPVIRATFEAAGSRAPDAPEFLAGLFDDFATANCWRADPQARAAIAAVREAGARAGVLSNFDARLRPVLDALGLEAGLDRVIASADVGAEKPDPEMFAAARRIAGTSGPIAHIGDEPEADGEGPLAAGWRQCLVLRPGHAAPPGLRAEADLLSAVRAVLRDLGL
jgi:putative hydrolase of the HAD superfamily